MRLIGFWKVLIGLTFVAAFSSPTPAGAQSYPAQSFCIAGGGGLMNRCGFATFEQCKENSANYGICVESARPADRYWIEQTPYARMGKPHKR